MPGSPDPVLGSRALTLAVAAAVGALATALPWTLRDRVADAWRFALAGGLAYSLATLGLWAGARFATDAFTTTLVDHPGSLLVQVAVSGVVLGAQAGVPVYLHARWRLVAPLAGLFGATTLVAFAFLQVRGESDPLGLYALVFGPAVVAGICVVALVEVGGRRLAARAG